MTQHAILTAVGFRSKTRLMYPHVLQLLLITFIESCCSGHHYELAVCRAGLASALTSILQGRQMMYVQHSVVYTLRCFSAKKSYITVAATRSVSFDFLLPYANLGVIGVKLPGLYSTRNHASIVEVHQI